MIGRLETMGPVLLGLIIIVLVLQDVFEVLLLPRRVGRRKRLAIIIFTVTWRFWRFAARGVTGSFRPTFLSVYGPISVAFLYLVWASCLIVAYGVCQWGLNGGGYGKMSLLANFYLSGSTFFTLGFGDVTPKTEAAKFLSVVEAANGFGLVAAVIGYLPVLYQSFSDREARVIQLDGRAGSPPSATFLLTQHGGIDAAKELDIYLATWEIWAAELLESHLSYPVLAFYRSHHDTQSWLCALSTILDTSAVILAGLDGVKPFQARMTFAMCRTVIVEMSQVLAIEPRPSETLRLTQGGFQALETALNEAGYSWQECGAEEKLTKLRLSYEPYAIAIAEYMMLKLPQWAPSSELDIWQTGNYGGLAKRLIDETGP